MTDPIIEAVVMVANEDGAEAAADKVAHELGVEEGLSELSTATNGAFGKRHDRLAAVLSELRQKKEVEA